MPRDLYVAFTMDCERIAAESVTGGPETWELGESAIRGYGERLLRCGFTPTFFCVPESAERHRDLLLGLVERGAEVGLHVHPQTFADFRYDKYLAEYDRDTQRRIITEELDALADTLGFRPTSFRPGNLSASDETYGLLADMGFRQGSVSLPERNAPGFAANWVGAERAVHWASCADRLRPGTLPFLEVPLTADPYRLQPNGVPYEIRIEHGGFEDWHRPIIDAVLRYMDEQDWPFRVLCILTHNFLDYGDPDCRHTETLKGMLEHIATLEGYRIVPTTLTELRAKFVERLGEPDGE